MKPPGYHLGDWRATCYQCGQSVMASILMKHWQGYWVCPRCFEPRHPQDFVRGVRDNQAVPFSQPQWLHDEYVMFCTLNGRSAIAGEAVGGCMIAGKELF